MHGAGTTPYNPDYPTGGGNFNPGIKIDTSRASVAPPSQPLPFQIAPGWHVETNPTAGVGAGSGPAVPLLPRYASGGAVAPGVSGGPRPTYYVAADANTKRTTALQKDVDRWLEHVHPRGDEPFVRAGVDRIAAAHGIKLSW
jgi:hypothetical protein